MNEILSISKTAFTNLIDAFLPQDGDPGPWGPLGPVIRDRLLWVLLNPQPLPPREGPEPDPWHRVSSPVPDPWHSRLGGIPVPWRSASLVRLVIHQAVSQYQWVEVMVSAEQLDKSAEIIRSQIRRFVDEFCGTRPPRVPWPWPPKFDPKELHPLEFLVAGAVFQKTAEAMVNGPLSNDVSAAADRLFETGLKRLEHGCET